MSLIYPLSLPEQLFAAAEMVERNVVGVVESPFTLRQQVQEFDGGGWALRLGLGGRQGDIAAEWAAFRSSLYGRAGTFLAGHPLRTAPRGSVAGSPVIDADHPSGKTHALRGFTASAANVLKKDDLFQVGPDQFARLYKVLNDVSADGSGEATLDIWPRWRVATSGAAEKLTNGNFETWGDTSTPGTWVKGGAAEGAYSQQAGHAGSFSCRITKVSGNFISLYQTTTLQPGKPYYVSLWVRSVSGTVNAAVFVTNVTVLKRWRESTNRWEANYSGASKTLSVGTGWAQLTFPFFVDPTFASADSYELHIYPAGAAGEAVEFDDASFRGPTFDGHPLVTTSPKCVFRLASNDLSSALAYRTIRGVTIDAVEAL